MIEESVKNRMQYYDDNIARYDSVIEKLSERAATYGDPSQLIAYTPDDKRAILCYNVIYALSASGFALNDKYKDVIEYIVSNKFAGVTAMPTAYYIDKSFSVKSHKMNYETFLTTFFPFGGKLTNENTVETYDSHRFFTMLVYSFYIGTNNEDSVFIRYSMLPCNHNKR